MTNNEGLGEPLLRPQEVADHYGVPVSTLHYWRRIGRGPVGIKVGRLLRYTPESVRRYRDAAPRPVAVSDDVVAAVSDDVVAAVSDDVVAVVSDDVVAAVSDDVVAAVTIPSGGGVAARRRKRP